MTGVVFVVPFGMPSTVRFVRAAASLADVRLGIISQEPIDRLPEDVRGRIQGFERVPDALDPAALEQAVRRIAPSLGGADRLIGILEQLQGPMATVRERLGIRGMSVDEAHNFRDKSRMKDILRARDLPCAGHRVATTMGDALAAAESLGFPLVVKPPAGAGACNTARVESARELESYLRAVPPTPAAPVLLEEFILGTEHSFDSVSIGGEHVFHSISRYAPTPLEVLETPWMQWCVLLPRNVDGPEYDDIRAAGRGALDALGMVTGMTHLEWFRREDGSVAISEVAARPPGAQFTSLLSYAHDRDFYRVWAEVMIRERFDPPERPYACGAAYLRGQGDGHVVDVSGFEEARRELGKLVVEAQLPRTGQVSANSYEGEGYVILRHPETKVVEEGLERLVSLVQVQLG